ncbi:MAG: glycosyltransferase family 2 protein, partial [Planctomycetaceae bacterium]|nr:glycosyltransferase family 2 protein [Planctomycetaceae bacterium]
MITILTPTYNRAYIIGKAYESLLRQTDLDFEWIIIDDGSSDDTKELVKGWAENNHGFPITYRYKENEGKPSALNVGFPLAKGELAIILDSDDYLSDDAVETIKYEWDQLSGIQNEIAGMVFLRGSPNTGKPMCNLFPQDHYRTNSINLRHKDHIKGEKIEVYRTEVWREFPFPVFENEKLCIEAVVTIRIATKYDVVFINKIIYWGDYLSDGYTAARKNKPIKENLLGDILWYNEETTRHFPLAARVSSMIKYIG